MIAEIVIFNGPPRPLSYGLTPDLTGIAQLGQRVVVPLGRRKALGFIIEISDEDNDDLKYVSEIIDSTPLLDKNHLELLKWLSHYYNAPLKDAASLFFPGGLTKPDSLAIYALIDKVELSRIEDIDPDYSEMLRYIVSRKKVKLSTVKSKFKSDKFYSNLSSLEDANLIKIGYRPIKSNPQKHSVDDTKEIDSQEIMLNPEQEQAFKVVTNSLQSNKFKPYLLFGVTGSGKSEIYLKLIWESICLGKTALLMLPEIASAEELYRKIKNRLGDIVCRIHSGLKAGDRLAVWEDIRSGRSKVVIGPRSALFAPLPKLGIIIVDEEHDSSYKQTGKSPQYHGRDLALIMGKICSCPVVLGSATPSMESWYNGQSGKYNVLRLTSRWDSRALPEIYPVEFTFTATGSSLSEELLLEMGEVLKGDGQIMLLLNRRGFAPTIKCGDCGFTLQCPNCSVGLVYHRNVNELRCHFCDYTAGKTDTCPQCSGNAFLFFGVGTQKLEEEIQIAFPKVSYARIDLDTVQDHQNLQATLDDFRNGKIRILIGTQMIAKSFDFPRVALMGILSADSYLEFPDFRSYEKTLALLLQASGRAGRGKYGGKVIIQHSQVYKQFIENVSEDNVEMFLENQLQMREQLNYPPFKHLIMIHLKAASRSGGEKVIGSLAEHFRHHAARYSKVFELLGPIESPLFKIRNNYRWQIMIKTGSVFKSLDIINYIMSMKPVKTLLSNLKVSIDVDPVDML
jgi:primosomal protein N' (replication factor Y) (superfamily II helicase)